MKRLRIPYVSQNGPGASYGIGDCGLACATALIRAFKDPDVQVDTLSRQAGLAPGYTSARIMTLAWVLRTKYDIKTIWAGGLTPNSLRRELDDNRSVILLVRYPALIYRRLKWYRDNHFITIHGYEGSYFYYDDPEWWSATQGEDVRIHEHDLITAARQVLASTPSQGLLLRSHQLPDVTHLY